MDKEYGYCKIVNMIGNIHEEQTRFAVEAEISSTIQGGMQLHSVLPSNYGVTLVFVNYEWDKE